MFTGLSAFPLTPADAEGVVDTAALGVLLDRLCGAKVASIGVLGSTGGYAYLDRIERQRAVDAAVECVAGRVPLIVGVGALRTSWAQELARDAERAGADGRPPPCSGELYAADAGGSLRALSRWRAR